MKHLLLLFTIAIFYNQLHAQKWGNRTAVWKHHYNWGNNNNIVTRALIADTIVLGKTCIRIGHYQPEISYLSGDTVYFLKEGAFRPTYYFAAQPGDTISFYIDSTVSYNCGVSNTRLAIVDAVDSINAGAKFIKQFSVSLITDTARPDMYYKKFKYYENIGSDNDIYPLIDCVIDPEMYNLCNYGDSSITGYYLFPQDINTICSFIKTGINETQKLTINHNWQSANVLNINLQEYASISIYNAIGQCIQQSQATPGNNAIAFNQPPGIYIVLAQSANGISTSKLYKP